MKTYLVGGAVRDELLGCPVTDRGPLARLYTKIAKGASEIGFDI